MNATGRDAKPRNILLLMADQWRWDTIFQPGHPCRTPNLRRLASEGVELDRDGMSKAVFDVAKRTGDNISSMLQDVRAKRRTEIDSINGYLVKVAKRRRAPCPVNEELVSLILKKNFA